MGPLKRFWQYIVKPATAHEPAALSPARTRLLDLAQKPCAANMGKEHATMGTTS
jgi:hypothetical protein